MTVRDRLQAFIQYKGLSNKAFEVKCGLGNGFVSKVGDSIRKEKIEMISKIFPELNTDWIVNEKGSMLHCFEVPDDFTPQGQLIPLLPVSAQGGSLSDFVVTVMNSDCEKVVSPVRGADFALPVSGDSMAPEYPNGSQVHVKKINERAFIEWGKVYVLDTCNGVVIKRVVPSERDGCIKCLSINPAPIYAPFDVSLADIYGIYRVMLCLSVK